MANVSIPYLVIKPGKLLADGTRGERWYWQPSAALSRAGWQAHALPTADDIQPGESDRDAALRQAVAKAKLVERWRAGEKLEGTPASDNPPASPGPGTLLWVKERYMRHRLWLRLADRTRSDYAMYLRILEEWLENDALRTISKADVEELYLTYHDDTPAKANALIRFLRLFLNFALGLRAVSHNAALQPKLEQLDSRVLIYPRTLDPLFVAAADALGLPSVGDAIQANCWLGQRPDDLLKFPAIAVGNTTILRQSKRGAKVTLPLQLLAPAVPRLRLAAARWSHRSTGRVVRLADRRREADDGADYQRLFARDGDGSPWTRDGFGRAFRLVREHVAKQHRMIDLDDAQRIDVDAWAGRKGGAAQRLQAPIEAFKFHWTRHTCVNRLSSAGANATQISRWTGHSIKECQRMIDLYAGTSAELVEQVAKLRLEYERTLVKEGSA